MNDPIFLDSWKAPFFWQLAWYIHIFFAQRFFEAACSLGIQLIDRDICLTTSNKWVQKNQWAVYELVNILDDQVYEWARYMNGVGIEMLARTPVPQLPLSYPPRDFIIYNDKITDMFTTGYSIIQIYSVFYPTNCIKSNQHKLYIL